MSPTRLSDRRLRLGRISAYVEWRDIWMGVYIAPSAVYVCALPTLVIKVDR
jgi:hypothetical protein